MAVKLIFKDGKPANSEWRMRVSGEAMNVVRPNFGHVLEGLLPKACHSPEPICNDYSNIGYDGCFNCPHHKEPA